MASSEHTSTVLIAGFVLQIRGLQTAVRVWEIWPDCPRCEDGVVLNVPGMFV